MPIGPVQDQKVQWVLPTEVTRWQGFMALQDSNPVLGAEQPLCSGEGRGLSRPSVTSAQGVPSSRKACLGPMSPPEMMGVCLQGLVSWGLLSNTQKTQPTCC